VGSGQERLGPLEGQVQKYKRTTRRRELAGKRVTQSTRYFFSVFAMDFQKIREAADQVRRMSESVARGRTETDQAGAE